MKKLLLVFSASILLAITAINLWASDPCGVYALIESVTFEPSEKAPTRVQLWGAFALSDGKHFDQQKEQPGTIPGYLVPAYGYMYFSLTPGKEKATLAEWADLKKVAGTGNLIAFGGRYEKNGRIRRPAEKVNAPDVYPIQMGITDLRTVYSSTSNNGYGSEVARMMANLKKALQNRS